MEQQPPRPPSKPLTFRPITDGLGFHPFSDGLPYAPVGKTHHSSGASSAGPAQPVGLRGIQIPTTLRPTAKAPAQPAMPAARPAPRISVPVASAGAAKAPAAPKVESRVPAPLENLGKESFGFAYVAKRVLAYGLDTTLNTALCAAALSAALVRQDLNPDTLVSPGVILLFSLFLIIFNWALIAAQEVAFGTSVGKRIFGLTLNGSASATFLRAFFFLPSVGFAGVGLLWALFNRRRRCWHDSAVDLQPMELARL